MIEASSTETGEKACLYLVKDSDDLVSWCQCEKAYASFPGQMDCPWCGCGWLFTCLRCRRAFTFARAEYLEQSLESLGREDILGFGGEATDEDLKGWIEGMKEIAQLLEEGERYVYLDGHFIPADTGPLGVEGMYSDHEFEEVPQVTALKDASVIEEILANPNYWKERSSFDS